MSSKNSKMASALRAGLGKEDAALAERLPDVPAESAGPVAADAPAVAVSPAPAGQSVPPAAAPTQPADQAVKTSAPKPEPGKTAARRKATPVKAAAAPAEAVPTPSAKAKPASGGSPAASTKVPAKKLAARAAPKAETVPPIVDVGIAPSRDPIRRKSAKGVKESFRMLAVEHRRLKLLRASLAVSRKKPGRSDMLRVALNLLEACDKAELVRLLDTLPPMAADRKGGKKR